MKNIFPLSLLNFALFCTALSGCSLFEKNCDLNQPFRALATSPLISNDKQVLIADDVGDGNYTWEGPTGQYAEGKEVTIDHFPESMFGEWTVTAAIGKCEYTASVTIEHDSISIPCTVGVNEAHFTNGIGNWQLDYLYYDDDDGIVFHSEDYPYGQMDIQIPNSSLPQYDATYEIEPNGGGPLDGNGYAGIHLDLGGFGSTATANSGTLYLKKQNGQTIISFCDVEFTAYLGSTTATFTGSAEAEYD